VGPGVLGRLVFKDVVSWMVPMAAPQLTQYDHSAVKLALLDALTAGIALGYLAHENRETLASHSSAIGLSALVLVGAIAALRVVVRVLRRANRRVEAIFADELRGRRGR
jgi:hypothetical protein